MIYLFLEILLIVSLILGWIVILLQAIHGIIETRKTGTDYPDSERTEWVREQIDK